MTLRAHVITFVSIHVVIFGKYSYRFVLLTSDPPSTQGAMPWHRHLCKYRGFPFSLCVLACRVFAAACVAAFVAALSLIHPGGELLIHPGG